MYESKIPKITSHACGAVSGLAHVRPSRRLEAVAVFLSEMYTFL